MNQTTSHPFLMIAGCASMPGSRHARKLGRGSPGGGRGRHRGGSRRRDGVLAASARSRGVSASHGEEEEGSARRGRGQGRRRAGLAEERNACGTREDRRNPSPIPNSLSLLPRPAPTHPWCVLEGQRKSREGAAAGTRPPPAHAGSWRRQRRRVILLPAASSSRSWRTGGLDACSNLISSAMECFSLQENNAGSRSKKIMLVRRCIRAWSSAEGPAHGEPGRASLAPRCLALQKHGRNDFFYLMFLLLMFHISSVLG